MPSPSPNSREPVLVAFGAALRDARRTKGISQEEVAHRSGIDRSYLGAIERGEQNCGLLHLAKIATALDVTIAELVAAAHL